jgi:hypothetical protein
MYFDLFIGSRGLLLAVGCGILVLSQTLKRNFNLLEIFVVFL